MIDQEKYDSLLPRAYEWAKAQEDFVLTYGTPLGARHLEDARLAGVHDCEKIRVLVVDRIPLPDCAPLAEAARMTGIMGHDTKCVGFGHAIIIRADSWNDRELLLHNFVHIAQCERSGGLESWIGQYLGNRRTCAQFSVGSFEDEARSLARSICRDAALA
jgi:hypothetical protein